MRFYEVEPFGELQMDLRFGLLLSLFFGANYKGKMAPEEFFPSLRVERPPTDWELRKLEWRALAEAQKAAREGRAA